MAGISSRAPFSLVPAMAVLLYPVLSLTESSLSYQESLRPPPIAWQCPTDSAWPRDDWKSTGLVDPTKQYNCTRYDAGDPLPTASQCKYKNIAPSGGHACQYDWECGFLAPDAATIREASQSSTGMCSGKDKCAKHDNQLDCTSESNFFQAMNGGQLQCAWDDRTKTCKGRCECFKNKGTGQPTYGCSNCMVKLGPVGYPLCPDPRGGDQTGGYCCQIPTGFTTDDTSSFLQYSCTSGIENKNRSASIQTCDRWTPNGPYNNGVDQCDMYGGVGLYGVRGGSGKNKLQAHKYDDLRDGTAANNQLLGSAGDCTVGRCRGGVCDGDRQCSAQWFNGATTGLCIAVDPIKDPSGKGKCACSDGYGCESCQMNVAYDALKGHRCGDFNVGGAGCYKDEDCNYSPASTGDKSQWTGGKCVDGHCKCHAGILVPGFSERQDYVCSDCSVPKSRLINASYRTDWSTRTQFCPCAQPTPDKPPGLYCARDGVFDLKLNSGNSACAPLISGKYIYNGQLQSANQKSLQECTVGRLNGTIAPPDNMVSINPAEGATTFKDQITTLHDVYAVTCQGQSGGPFEQFSASAGMFVGEYQVVHSQMSHWLKNITIANMTGDMLVELADGSLAPSDFEPTNFTWHAQVSRDSTWVRVYAPLGCETQGRLFMNVTYSDPNFAPPLLTTVANECEYDPYANSTTAASDCWRDMFANTTDPTLNGTDPGYGPSWPNNTMPRPRAKCVQNTRSPGGGYCSTPTSWSFAPDCNAANGGNCRTDINQTIFFAPEGTTTINVIYVPWDCDPDHQGAGARINSETCCEPVPDAPLNPDGTVQCTGVDSPSGSALGISIYKFHVTRPVRGIPWAIVIPAIIIAAILFCFCLFHTYIWVLRQQYKKQTPAPWRVKLLGRKLGDDKAKLMDSEWCSQCEMYVPAKLYVGEDICPRCGNWL